MLANILSKTSGIKPFVGSLAESTQVRFRWYKDNLENRKLKREGYYDAVKQEGPMPRLKNDSAPYHQLPTFKAKNNWTPSKATAGQNDYIDILGENQSYLDHLLMKLLFPRV